MTMYRFTLSEQDVKALKAMAAATRDKCVLPARYVFRRDAADHLVRLGLAEYRGFDGKSHGGYWLTSHGKFQLSTYCESASGEGK